MIIDAVTYFNEQEILNFRMKLLWDKVDLFVVVDANVTHAGAPKPHYFLENLSSFEWAAKKLLYYPMNIDTSDLDLSVPKPKSYDPSHPAWEIEHRQRNGILTACTRYDDAETLIISDVDEIPSYEAFCEMRDAPFWGSVCEQKIISPSVTKYNPVPWCGSIFTSLGWARTETPQGLRDQRQQLTRIREGGWHLSYHGGAERIKRKLEAFAHQEFNTEERTNLDSIQKHLLDNTDILGSGASNRTVGKEFYPEYFVQQVPEEWWTA